MRYTSAWVFGLCWTWVAGAAVQEWALPAAPPPSPIGIEMNEDPWVVVSGPSISAVEKWLEQGGDPNQLISYPSPFAVLPEDITEVTRDSVPTIAIPVWQVAALEGNLQVIDLLLKRGCSLIMNSTDKRWIVEILAADVQTSDLLQRGTKNLHALLGDRTEETWLLLQAEGEMETWVSAAREWLFFGGIAQQEIARKLWTRTELWIL